MVELKLELPDGFLNEEVRDGYTVTGQMKEIWAVELDLFAEFQRVCDAHHLRYFTDGGTTLGVVRHGGFIPWDDDIDIVMFRKDYIKLCSVAADELRDPYFFQTDYTDPGSNRGHAQLRNSETTAILYGEKDHDRKFNQGIFIDIFPMDYMPDDETERRKYIETVQQMADEFQNYYNHSLRYVPAANPTKDALKRVLRKFYLRFNIKCTENPKFRKLEQYVTDLDQKPTGYITKVFFSEIKPNMIWKTEWFEDKVDMKFENLTVPVPSGYLDFLRAFFGEWEIPVRSPSYHGTIFFDTNVSYRKYLDEKK